MGSTRVESTCYQFMANARRHIVSCRLATAHDRKHRPRRRRMLFCGISRICSSMNLQTEEPRMDRSLKNNVVSNRGPLSPPRLRSDEGMLGNGDERGTLIRLSASVIDVLGGRLSACQLAAPRSSPPLPLQDQTDLTCGDMHGDATDGRQTISYDFVYMRCAYKR